jgi:hypothetical protein
MKKRGAAKGMAPARSRIPEKIACEHTVRHRGGNRSVSGIRSKRAALKSKTGAIGRMDAFRESSECSGCYQGFFEGRVSPTRVYYQ